MEGSCLRRFQAALLDTSLRDEKLETLGDPEDPETAQLPYDGPMGGILAQTAQTHSRTQDITEPHVGHLSKGDHAPTW